MPYYLGTFGAHVCSISITSAHAEHYESLEFRVIFERIEAWYERAESLEPTVVYEMKPSHLRGPIQLAEIAKVEEP